MRVAAEVDELAGGAEERGGFFGFGGAFGVQLGLRHLGRQRSVVLFDQVFVVLMLPQRSPAAYQGHSGDNQGSDSQRPGKALRHTPAQE